MDVVIVVVEIVVDMEVIQSGFFVDVEVGTTPDSEGVLGGLAHSG